jgi:hypothetical protein
MRELAKWSVFGLWLAACGSSSPQPTAATVEAIEATNTHVYNGAILGFVASNAYHDFPSLAVKEDSKFEVFLLPTITPAEVAAIDIEGPDRFSFALENEPFGDALNGYIVDDREPTLWYQAIRTQTLSDGRYTLRVTFTNGETQTYARDLVSNHALVQFYLDHAAELQFQPSSGNSSASDTVLQWSTLHDVGGPDAYYNAWISTGTSEAIGADQLRGDNIFVAALLDPNAGLNVNNSALGNWLDPLPVGPLTWQVEILDSNQLDGVNQIIFPPGRNFSAQ